MTYWIYLIIAAVFEVGWPVGFKLASTTDYKTSWILFSVAAMTLSGIFLYLAQKGISIGTAYAVWTGIGATCTFLVGILFFEDSTSMIRILGAALILGGVVLLKLGH